MTDDRMDAVAFESELRDLVIEAIENGVTVEGGWVLRDLPGHDQDLTVEITRVKRGADD